MRLLVIDDSGTVLGMLRALLGEAGHEVQVAADGEKGLEAIDASEPDVVICDLKMPKLDGLSVVRAIRDRSATLPVVIFTDQGDIPLAVEAMRLGAFSYVVKGSPVERLIQEIDSAYAHRNRLERARALERERSTKL